MTEWPGITYDLKCCQGAKQTSLCSGCGVMCCELVGGVCVVFVGRVIIMYVLGLFSCNLVVDVFVMLVHMIGHVMTICVMGLFVCVLIVAICVMHMYMSEQVGIICMVGLFSHVWLSEYMSALCVSGQAMICCVIYLFACDRFLLLPVF